MDKCQSADLSYLLEQAPENLVHKEMLGRGAKQPSAQAVEILAKMIVNKGVREGKLSALSVKGKSA
jgi:hypothetical protein